MGDGVIYALLSNNFSVDILAPGFTNIQCIYPKEVNCYGVEYRLRWLKNLFKVNTWRKYDLLLGTPDLPMAIVGLIGTVTGRKLITVCDEIFIGGYEGTAKLYWKWLAQYGMRKSAITIITDTCRENLQRQYARLPKKHRFIQYPCSFFENKYLFNRDYWRKKLDIREDELLLSISGQTSIATGIHWALSVLDKLPVNYVLFIQPGGLNDTLADILFKRLSRKDRIIYFPGRLSSFVEAMSINYAADIGLVFYLSEKPQFQQMGVSSNKLCMYLQMGKPVIVNRQSSFEFIDTFKAGKLIDNEGELVDAIIEIASDYETYSRNAINCFNTYINPYQKFLELKTVIKEISS